MLVEAIEKSRSLSHELSPPGLSKSDLHEAFEWLAQQFQTKHGLTVFLDAREGIELPSEPLRAILYKAAQEMLFNVVKHAGVKEATTAAAAPGRIYLPVRVRQGPGIRSERTRPYRRVRAPEHPGTSQAARWPYEGQEAKGKGSTFLIIVPDSQPQMTQPKNIAIQSVPRHDPGPKADSIQRRARRKAHCRSGLLPRVSVRLGRQYAHQMAIHFQVVCTGDPSDMDSKQGPQLTQCAVELCLIGRPIS